MKAAARPSLELPGSVNDYVYSTINASSCDYRWSTLRPTLDRYMSTGYRLPGCLEMGTMSDDIACL